MVDDFTKECLAAMPDTSIGGERLVAELDRIVERRGKPTLPVSDNDPEMTGRAVLRWTAERGANWHDITPNTPTRNAFIEAFSIRLRDECLNEHVFTTLADAIEKIECWRIDYNTNRPHGAIGNQTPAAFAAANVLAMVSSRSERTGEALRYARGFAPRPVAPPSQTGSNAERTRPSAG